jgi:hypothetical protein
MSRIFLFFILTAMSRISQHFGETCELKKNNLKLNEAVKKWDNFANK